MVAIALAVARIDCRNILNDYCNKQKNMLQHLKIHSCNIKKTHVATSGKNQLLQQETMLQHLKSTVAT